MHNRVMAALLNAEVLLFVEKKSLSGRNVFGISASFVIAVSITRENTGKKGVFACCHHV
jgi:hypothetical protein